MLSKLAKQPVAKKEAQKVRVLADWGDAKSGIIHFLLCSSCGKLPPSGAIFICTEGHVTCDSCGDSLTSCPYTRLRNQLGCRKLISRITMCIAQQQLTSYLASCIDQDHLGISDGDEEASKASKVSPTVVEAEKNLQKERPTSEDLLAQTATGKCVEEEESCQGDELEAGVAEKSKVKVAEKSKVKVAEKSKVKVAEKSKVKVAEKSKVKVTEKSKVVKPEDPEINNPTPKSDHVVITIEESLKSPKSHKISRKQRIHIFTEQKIAEFSHLPHEEKVLAVKAAIEEELRSQKKSK